MSLIDIGTQDLINWHGSAQAGFARLTANQSFVTSEDIIIPACEPNRNAFYQQFTWSLVSGKIRIAAGQAYSTTDSDNPNGTYALSLYDSNGKLLLTIHTHLRIPSELSPTLWTSIFIYSEAMPQPERFDYYTADQVNRLLADLSSNIPKASATALGITKLSIAPVDSQVPIAVGDNDPRLTTGVIDGGSA